MLLLLRAEPQLIGQLECIAEAVPAAEPVLYLAEYLADLVLDSIRALGFCLNPCRYGKQVAIDEGDEIIARQGGVMVERAVGLLRCGPLRPAVRLIYDEVVRLPPAVRP
jgi:hypothetical protein